MENNLDRRIYNSLKKLPEYFKENDFSKAFLKFMNDLMDSFKECEDRRERCEKMLDYFLDRGTTVH